MLRPLAERIYQWLSPCDAPAPADLIFAIAGRQTRKLFALQLYAHRLAPALLLSVARYEIRRFAQLPLPAAIDLAAVAAQIPAPQRHFFVKFEAATAGITHVRRSRLGTLSEMRALAAWLRNCPSVTSIMVVSSGFHLRRIRLCARFLLPPNLQIRYSAAPDDNPFSPASWWLDRRARWLVLAEFPKLAAYWLALVCKDLHSPGAE